MRLIDNNNEDNNYTEGAIVIRVRLVANEGTDEVTFTDPMVPFLFFLFFFSFFSFPHVNLNSYCIILSLLQPVLLLKKWRI